MCNSMSAFIRLSAC